MKITGVRTRLYEFTAGRGLGDANLPTGSDRGNGLAVFVDTDEGVTGVTTGSPGARAAIHELAESLLVDQMTASSEDLHRRVAGAVEQATSRAPADVRGLPPRTSRRPWRHGGGDEDVRSTDVRG